MKPTVLFIKGIRDDKSVTVHSMENDGILFNVGGGCNIYKFIDNDQFDKALLTLDAKQNSSINTMGCRVFVNQISDFDTHKIALNKVSNLLAQLDGQVSCINHPRHIERTTRDAISQRLQGIDGLLVPKTIRITPKSPDDVIAAIQAAQLDLPVLMRECGQHGGNRTVLLKSDVDFCQFYALALDGREYYLTAYYDYAVDGIYRKHRLAIVDGKPYIRHLIVSDDWMIHSKSRTFMDDHPEYAELESQLLVDFQENVAPVIQPTITAICECIKLDYFGIDCNIDNDGTMLVFEINAIMNMLLNNAALPNKWQQPVETIRQAIIDLVMTRVTTT